MSKELLHIENASVGYGQKVVLDTLNLSLKSDELTVLLGPNGSGKSTLIRSISGVQKLLSGRVCLKDIDLTDYQIKKLAHEISLVLTDNLAPGNLSVFSLVALGRFPYTSWLGSLSQADEEVIQWAIQSAGVEEFANRQLGELSDGEKQKVMIARALAQEADLMILDEPTAHLDSPNRIEIFHLLKTLTKHNEKAILISTHDIETALRYADRLWLVVEDRVVTGIPEDLVLQGHLEEAFKAENVSFDYQKGTFNRNIATENKGVNLSGDPVLVHWLGHALERNGFHVSQSAALKIFAEGTKEAPLMRIDGVDNSYETIEKLLLELTNEES